MSSLLPDKPIAATRTDPKIIIIYGPPKIGKTTKVAELKNNLILDFERGTELIDALKVPITSISGPTTVNAEGVLTGMSLDDFSKQLIEKAQAAQVPGKPLQVPYKFLTIDTIDKLEELCEVTATEKYKQSTIGKSFTGRSVIELPNGAGYYHLRNEVLLKLDEISMMCKHLIVVSHIREKNINKGGIDVSVADISLTGRLGAMVCAKADVIGYVYRESPTKPLMISFETLENNVMGARIPRLAGKRIPFEWSQIFLDENVNSPVV